MPVANPTTTNVCLRTETLGARLAYVVASGMPTSSTAWQHPWLRIQRLLREMLRGGWDPEAWKLVKPEIRKALEERRQIERAGWFN